MSANNVDEQIVQVSQKWLLELHQEITAVRNKTFPPRDETEALFHTMIGIQSHLSDVLDMIEAKFN